MADIVRRIPTESFSFDWTFNSSAHIISDYDVQAAVGANVMSDSQFTDTLKRATNYMSVVQDFAEGRSAQEECKVAADGVARDAQIARVDKFKQLKQPSRLRMNVSTLMITDQLAFIRALQPCPGTSSLYSDHPFYILFICIFIACLRKLQWERA